MTVEEQVLAEVQALRHLIEQYYGWDAYRCPIQADTRDDTDWNRLAALQIKLSFVFERNERDLRLHILNILLGLEGIEITTTKDLWAAELKGLLAWLLDNQNALVVVRTIKDAPNIWAERIGLLKKLKRPLPKEIPPVVETWDAEIQEAPVGTTPSYQG